MMRRDARVSSLLAHKEQAVPVVYLHVVVLVDES